VAGCRIAPADRAGLVDAIFIAAYLANSLPAVIAGLASEHYGLHDTALVYNAVIAALVAAAAAMTGLRRRPPRSRQAVSQPGRST
jgi:predicted MFS family arabinose efflux permease